MGDSSAPAADFDAVIVGGGIAGLWLLRRLRESGYRAVLLTSTALGDGQTLASQGIIHGGLKYALAGRFTRAAEQIADMPARWTACLEGRGEIDLRALAPLRESLHLFAAAGTLGRLTGFLASRSLRGQVTALAPSEFPTGLSHPGFRGSVHRLTDFVLPVPELLRALVEPVADCVYTADALPALSDATLSAHGVRLALAGGDITARHLILAAGSGNAALLARLGLGYPRMQRRPLAQVIVRAPDLPPLFAHCLTGIRRPEPRLTITSHPDGSKTLWYLGGQIATDGVDRDRSALTAHARAELRACLPWHDWSHAEIDVLAIDRAEPLQTNGQRPDQAFATRTGESGRCLVVWPTKLSLAPDLGDQVLTLLASSSPNGNALPPQSATTGRNVPAQPRLALPAATLGTLPWSRDRLPQIPHPAIDREL